MKTPEAFTDSNISDPAVQAILRALDTEAGRYSVATQMRLNDARAHAITATRSKTPFWRSTPFLGAAFAMAAAYTFVILMPPASVASSAELEAAALYDATFGADVAQEAGANPEALFDTKLSPTVLDETDLDETVVANDLEFYAWLSETSAQRATQANVPGDSDS